MMESVSLINCVLMKLKSRLWSRHWSSNNLLSRQSKMERKGKEKWTTPSQGSECHGRAHQSGKDWGGVLLDTTTKVTGGLSPVLKILLDK